MLKLFFRIEKNDWIIGRCSANMPNIEEIKQKIKETYAQKVDSFFEQFEDAKSSQTLDVNGIESLLGKGLADAREVILTTSEELVKTETDIKEGKKNRVPPAKKR